MLNIVFLYLATSHPDLCVCTFHEEPLIELVVSGLYCFCLTVVPIDVKHQLNLRLFIPPFTHYPFCPLPLPLLGYDKVTNDILLPLLPWQLVTVGNTTQDVLTINVGGQRKGMYKDKKKSDLSTHL